VTHTKHCRKCDVVLVKGSSKTTPKGNCYPSNMTYSSGICNKCFSSYYKKKRNQENIEVVVPLIKRKTSTIPFGYELSEKEKYLKPIPNDLKVLYVAQEWIKTGASYQEASDFIKENTGKNISRMGMWKKDTKNKTIPNFYNINLNYLKRNCKICDRIYFHSPVGTKQNGTGKRKYCSELCKRTNIARQNRLKHLYKMLNKEPKQGFIYCITNSSFEGWVKVGKALDTQKRLINFNGSTPYRNFKIQYQKQFENYNRAEYFILGKLNEVSEEQSSEWFKIDLEKAITLIKNYEDKDITEKNLSEFNTPRTNLISNLHRITYY